MNLTKCVNGHYYDADKFTSCPHCSESGDSGTVPFATVGGAAFSSGQGDAVTSAFSSGNLSLGSLAENDNVTMPVNPVASIPTQASEGDDAKTEAFYNWNAKKDAAGQATKTEGQIRKETMNPVVGWLVCIEGSNYGKAFDLYCGKNFIGRDTSMDICLSGDNSVSRYKHTIIVYEPKQKLFFAQPGESHELSYCNNEVILSSCRLLDRDVITIGQTKLMFVPFCNAKFSWEY